MLIENKLFENKADCCGCGACFNICPQQAIYIETDEYGYLFPNIIKEKCILCGLCEKVCPMNAEVKLHKSYKAYAASLKDEGVKEKSASGGVFAGIARNILCQNGVIYGAAYGENQYVHHIGISREQDLAKLQDSKYVQSDMENIYIDIKKQLLRGNKVLFSGTPCQVSALKLFLRKDYENLFTIDLICHGVPSYRLFFEGIHLVINKGEQIKSVSFRNKSTGWGTDGYIQTNKKKYKFDESKSSYYYYFLRSTLYRDSCYKCKYATDKRPGDITIGDYWRIETAHPKFRKLIDERGGVSCVLINSRKGEKLFDDNKDAFVFIESSVNAVVERNGRLNKDNSFQVPKERKELLDIYKNKGYLYLNKYWIKKSRKERCVIKIKEIVRPMYKMMRDIILLIER